MKRFAFLILLFLLSGAALRPAHAQRMTQKQAASFNAKAAKKQQKLAKKAAKQQRKGTKKAMKAQQKATMKANRDLAKRKHGVFSSAAH
jgi:hypothetical protein